MVSRILTERMRTHTGETFVCTTCHTAFAQIECAFTLSSAPAARAQNHGREAVSGERWRAAKFPLHSSQINAHSVPHAHSQSRRALRPPHRDREIVDPREGCDVSVSREPKGAPVREIVALDAVRRALPPVAVPQELRAAAAVRVREDVRLLRVCRARRITQRRRRLAESCGAARRRGTSFHRRGAPRRRGVQHALRGVRPKRARRRVHRDRGAGLRGTARDWCPQRTSQSHPARTWQ